ncbi:hypothetical protein DMI80_06635 [Akkermansia muciniphila]|uniref:RHS repeat domain-containing protein n=1 Tax=Akkermansia muciniphila TaxID=239935 RepID=UPI00138E6198|nr:RHS repeat-associated core domain-containing protein [Akkermansia muciniphila]QHV65593.1 hypothetical protein DMI78_06635 [Akkermansia muciniphila]QHV68035.1 hypothetical protein DMI79_06660 [Akkermansia muciniphila]QHV70507.1 hypothetical protein DMI80_06635 [Akkermansia muciniphila]QHV72963.1 hypothetical protein DMI81_06640 [Akkermansia muciniphila]HJE12831.1 RHS repeat-associated core domain-containing protein [Akkermansia muciniphila]
MQETTAYTTGPFNQYTAIERGEEAAFEPVHDADGNQTLIRTSTGIWQVAYNAENRPVRFVNESAKTVVECTYDYMGRRHTRKVSVNGAVSSYLRYMYRGYLQIAAIDAVSGVFRWFLFWDPTQPEAARPLAIRKDGTWYAYGWDLTGNVTEIFGKAGYLRTVYTYTPYGEATAEGDVTQPIQWSSEYNDDELGLVYYNYRHLNPHDGRWISRDPIEEEGGWNLFAFVKNQSNQRIDGMCLNEVIISGGCNTNMGGMNGSSIYFDRFITYFTLNVGQKFNISTFHDRNWSNFITAAEEQIKKRKENLRLGERIEWFVEYDSYRIRAINDKMGSQYYLDQIRKKSKELDVDLKFYKSKKDLAQLVNTIQVYQLDNITGTVTTIFMERSGQDRISRLVYYGHGYKGALTPRFPFPTYGVPNTEISITSEDIRQGIFQQGSFMQSAVVISCGCNTATPPDENIPSFAEVWKGFFGSVMYGVKGKTDYTNPKKPQPSGASEWMPKEPPL